MTHPHDAEKKEHHHDTLPLIRRFAGRRTAFPLLWRPVTAGVERLPVVSWFDPGQLLLTGAETLAALVVGKRADPRLVYALAARQTGFHDYTEHYADGPSGPQADRERPRDEVWIDYVCDTGDG